MLLRCPNVNNALYVGPTRRLTREGEATTAPGRRPPADKHRRQGAGTKMNVRHSRLARLVALTVVVSMPLLGMAGVASAKVGKNYCANHPNSKRAACQS